MAGPDRHAPQLAAPQRATPAWRKALAAARDRFDGSVAHDVVRELKALDFSNQATLFGAGLLASLLPFIILLSTFARARVDDYIALRLGLNRVAAGVVTHLFRSSHIPINAATVIGLVFIVSGTIAVASSLQQIYEKAFHLGHRGGRGLLRLPVWIIALCLTVAVETLVVRPGRRLPAGSGFVAVVTFVLMTVFFWWTMHFLLAGRIQWRTLLPPAVVTGILFAGFGIFSRFYFSRTIISNSHLYGAIGAVFSIMTWLIAIGAMIILGAVAGAVWQDRVKSSGGKRTKSRDGLACPGQHAKGTQMETVKSADGTAIAYDRAGDGPALIISVGAFCTRQTFVAPDDLTERFTVVTYDRRGRGDSGDTEPFAAQREYEDLAAIAAATGPRPPFVFGHSSGAAIALRSAAAGLPTAGIVAYEAPFANDDTPQPAIDPAERIRALVSVGRRGDAVTFWMSEIVRLPAQMLAQAAGAPWVKALEPFTPTLPYDIAVTAGGVPTAELEKITAPVLILGGKNSPGWFQRSVADQASAIPGARLTMLDGYDHNAPPEVIAPILIDFFAG